MLGSAKPFVLLGFGVTFSSSIVLRDVHVGTNLPIHAVDPESVAAGRWLLPDGHLQC
jgi:hypothetical protein